MKRNLIAVFITLYALSVHAGGGWTHPKGEGYFKLGQNFIRSDRFYAPDGSLTDITTIGLYTTSLYGEFGLTDKLTAIAYVPFFVRSTLNRTEFRFSGREIPGDELNSFGDTDLGLQFSLLKSDTWVMSARLIFGLPLGNEAGGESGILQTGDGEFNQILRLDVSRPLGKAWFSTYAAVNNRTGGFSDEYRLGAELGYKFSDRLVGIAKLDVVQSFFNGDGAEAAGSAVFGNNVEFVSPVLELAYLSKKGFGVSLSAAGAFAGKNILAAPNYGVGIIYALR